MPVETVIKDPRGTGRATVTNNRLDVNANLSDIDIQIGAVELKDATSTNRATINSDGELEVTLPDVEYTLDGQETLAVSIFNDITIVPEKVTTATNTAVSVGSSSTTVLALNASRKLAMIINDSDEVIYLKYASGATSNSGIRLNANGGTLIENHYTGIITGICASGSKVVTVVEL
jgi:hypothetical protein